MDDVDGDIMINNSNGTVNPNVPGTYNNIYNR